MIESSQSDKESRLGRLPSALVHVIVQSCLDPGAIVQVAAAFRWSVCACSGDCQSSHPQTILIYFLPQFTVLQPLQKLGHGDLVVTVVSEGTRAERCFCEQYCTLWNASGCAKAEASTWNVHQFQVGVEVALKVVVLVGSHPLSLTALAYLFLVMAKAYGWMDAHCSLLTILCFLYKKIVVVCCAANL